MIGKKVDFLEGVGTIRKGTPKVGTIIDKVKIENYTEGRCSIDAYVIQDSEGNLDIVKPEHIRKIIET